jgi:glycosyltransferase involved in cell wall biosynthesis
MSIKRDSAVHRLLVITYHFPPDGAIGGQRWAGLSKYLARLGWEVHVVTASPLGRERDDPGVSRHVRYRRRTLNDVYKAAVGRVRHASDADRQLTPGNPRRLRRSLLSRTLAAARRVVGNSIYLPDHARGWVSRAAGAARGLLRERKFDVVITSGPPHSAHFAGLLATRGSDAQFWIDMRDPWSTIHEMHLPEDRIIRAERFLLRRLERLVFPRATRVIVNTREFASALRADEPELNVVWFPNGIDLEQLPAREVSAVEQCSLAYVGTIYANRNLSSVFAAMRALLRDRPEAAAKLKLNVAGPLESPHRKRMYDDIAAAGLTSQVSIHGVLPRAQALELLSRSHLALVLAQDQPMCVPAKLYESVGLGVPTLVIAEEASAAACEARRIGAMTLDGGDVDGLRSLMEDMLAGRIPTRIETRTPISYEVLAVQMDRLLRGSGTA